MLAAPNSDFDAARFAALIARFDIANPSEAEAMTAARTIRRGLIEKNMRFVDVMARIDVTLALDALLKPAREESPELKAAFLEVAKYADLARQHAETAKKLRREMATSQTAPVGAVSRRLVVWTVIIAIALVIWAVWQ
jgi:hypothetical protein